MTGDVEAVQKGIMTTALEHLQQAISLLDQAEAPGQIAAHVDLAVHQLADALGVDLTATTNSSGLPKFEKLATS